MTLTFDLLMMWIFSERYVLDAALLGLLFRLFVAIRPNVRD